MRSRGSFKLGSPKVGSLAAAWVVACSLARMPFLATAAEREAPLAAGELTVGARVEHALELPAAHYVDIAVDQGTLDLAVRLLAPDGSLLAASDVLAAGRGAEYLTALVGSGGAHRVAIEARGPIGAAGTYALRIETLRPEVPGDAARVRGERAYSAGLEAARQRDDAGRRAAAEHYTEAASHFRQAGDAYGEAKARHNRGAMLRRLGDGTDARRELAAAITLWTAAGAATEEVDSRLTMARLLRDLGHHDEAIAQARAAIAMVEPIDDARRAAQAHHTMGRLLKETERQEEAVSAYRRALGFRLAAGDRRGEATTRNSLGSALRDLGDYQAAAAELDQAIELFELSDPRRLAAPLNALGVILETLQQFDRAERYFERALEVLDRYPDPAAEAMTLNNLGWLAMWTDRPAAAVGRFGRALERLAERPDAEAEAIVLSNLAHARSKLGEHRAARAALAKALTLRRAAGTARGEARTLVAMAEVDRALGALDTAAEAAERARLLATAQDDPLQAEAHLVLGRIAAARGREHVAVRRMETALGHFEALRGQLRFPAWRATVLAGSTRYYNDFIDLLMGLHRQEPDAGWAARALAISEQARSRTLIDTLRLRDLRIDEVSAIDTELAVRERRLRQRIDQLAQQRAGVAEPGSHEEVATALADTLAEHQMVRARIDSLAPRKAALTTPPTVDADTIGGMLGPDQALIEITLGDERSTIWLVEAERLVAARLPGKAALAPLCRDLLGALTARDQRIDGEGLAERNARIRRQDAEADALAARIGRLLLAPLAERGGRLRARRLAFVVDGPLAAIPLALLHDPATAAPLHHHHEVVHVPSASAVAALRAGPRQAGPRQAGAGAASAIVFGDPVFSAEDPRVAAGDRTTRETPPAATRSGLARLPASRLEAERVARLVGPGSDLRLGFEATREAALGSLGEHRFVHFATHGWLDAVHPELSSLVLSTRDRAGRPIDGHLRLHDIYRLELSADLVVLSACRSAAGRELAGEGLIGLAHGFMHAGARQVIASLWQVRDDATAELMAGLYRRLMAGADPVTALRHAQAALRADHRFEAPYYWAGFVVQGDWS